MSRRTKRGIVITCVLGFVAALGSYFFWPPSRAISAGQAVSDIGKFRVGSALGEERTGFSGRTKVTIFAGGPDSAALSTCLRNEAIEAQMDFFTGVLVDESAEPEVEADLRAQGLRVVVRGLQGQVLGLLHEGYTCDDFVALLRQVRAASTRAAEKSPIYVNLLERPAEVVDYMVERGQGTDAARYVQHLEEFEGSASPAVQAAKARAPR